MPDREKVIKGLEHCTSHDDGRDKFGGVGKCGGCPYYGYDCTGKMKQDALALLKEQEAVEPILDSFLRKRCPSCRTLLKGKYCYECGQAVKWE